MSLGVRVLLVVAVVWSCAACAGEAAPLGVRDGGADAARDDAAVRDADSRDADSRDAYTRDVAGVELAHTRELRAMWVATVSRLDFPSRTGLSETEARREVQAIVDVAADAGFNALFFQVRAESDALYASSLEPWSRFLSGTQGTDPGYDPLALMLEVGHARGLEVHAWMNPYRAKTSTSIVAAANHVTNRFPSAAITYNGAVVMDPSNTDVRAHIVAVVAELTRNYDLDGVVFDDYFYPYPDSAGTPFPDRAAFDAYTRSGGALSRSDWRRENVNALVAAVSTAIKAEKSWVRWGVAPFGIYRPNMPAGVVGLDSYEVISCDPLRWMEDGTVDYLSPQLYWPSTSSGQPYGALIAWWASHSRPGRPIIPALALYRLGSTAAWTVDELDTQIGLTRDEAPATSGATWFRHAFLRDDLLGSRAVVTRLYAAPARPPALPGHADDVVVPPSAVLEGRSVTLTHSAAGTLAGFAVYRFDAGAWTYARWVPVAEARIALDAGRFAISAIARSGAESRGVELVVR